MLRGMLMYMLVAADIAAIAILVMVIVCAVFGV